MSKRGRRLGKLTLKSQARELVVKLHEYFESESQNGGPLIPVTQVGSRVSAALGIGRPTISLILKEKYGPSGCEENVLRSPKKCKRRRSKPITGINQFDKDAIRNHIYSYFIKGEFPTLSALRASLVDTGLFNGCKESLRIILREIGFQFQKVGKRKILMERTDIVLQRVTFMREIKKITNWDNVIFLKETWLNPNHDVLYTGTDNTQASSLNLQMIKDGRLMICQIGSAGDKFVKICLPAFQSNNTKDNQEELNVTFKECFRRLLDNIPTNTVIIMDNTPFLSIQINEAPTQINTKAAIVFWLQQNGVEVDKNLLKIELLYLVKEHKPNKPVFLADKLAEERGHKIIRIPPHHCQYNAMELISAKVQGYAAQHSIQSPLSVDKMGDLLKEAWAQVTKEEWVQVVEMTKQIVIDDFERDIHIDRMMENKMFVNSSNDDSSSSSSDSE